MTTFRALAGLAMTYLIVLTTGFLFYLLLIRTPLFGGESILFYRGIAVALVAALAILISGLAAKRWIALDLPTLVGGVALSLAFNISFLITFPVTFDRSITMFLLARIELHDGRLNEHSLERLFVQEYLGDMRQIDRRIREQGLSGNIHVSGGRIFLTPQGKKLLSSGRVIGGWFGADPRFITASPARH